jgi:hypothetical protein
MSDSTGIISDVERVVTKKSMHETDDDSTYWLALPASERWAAVEQMRRTYYGWADGTEPRLLRVLRITHRQ